MDHCEAYLTRPGSLPFPLPRRVTINEVGPRDGFQLERRTIPTHRKVGIIDALSRTGVDRLQVTSFARPEAVPQLTDADEVMASITRAPGVTYTVLVPNLLGAQRALRHGADGWDLMLSVSDAHNLANANRTTAETLESLRPVIELAGEHEVELTAGLGTALGCPFEGRVSYDRVAWVVGSLHELGVRRMAVCDTVGVADPGHGPDRRGRYPRLPAVRNCHGHPPARPDPSHIQLVRTRRKAGTVFTSQFSTRATARSRASRPSRLRTTIPAGVAAVLLLTGCSGFGSDGGDGKEGKYPERPVSFSVGSEPGSGWDATARAIVETMEKEDLTDTNIGRCLPRFDLDLVLVSVVGHSGVAGCRAGWAGAPTAPRVVLPAVGITPD